MYQITIYIKIVYNCISCTERLNNGNNILKFNLEQVSKTQRGSRCIALLFL
jgi:hypothetical protein